MFLFTNVFQSVARLKEEQHRKATAPALPPKPPPQPPSAEPKSILKNSTKRKAGDETYIPSKHSKTGALPSGFFDSGVKKPNLGIASYASSSDEDEESPPSPQAPPAADSGGVPSGGVPSGGVPGGVPSGMC